MNIKGAFLSKKYSHNSAARNNHEKKWTIVAATVFLLAAILWLLFLLRNSTDEVLSSSTDETKSQSVGEQLNIASEVSYLFRIPDGWSETDRFEDDEQQYVQYQADKSSQDAGRTFEIYQGGLPLDSSVTRIMSINLLESGAVSTNSLSDQCYKFSDPQKSILSSGTLSALYEGIPFNCNFSETIDTVGTGSAQDGLLAEIRGETSSAQYFFKYIDQSEKPNFEVMSELLGNFQSK